MRDIPPELQARLDSGATTLCRCWRVRRRDGLVLGFTDHDADLVFEGVTFRAGSGMDASALQSATGLAVDNAQASGALTDAAISEADIRAGRFDDADIHQWIVDWSDVSLRVLMFRGTFGEIRRSDGAFEVEVRGLAEKLNVSVGRAILRTCDCRLGDARCGVELSTPAFSAEAVAAEGSAGALVVASGLEAFSGGWFRDGTLTWLSGSNSGRRVSIKEDALRGDGDRLIRLREQAPLRIAAGDRFRIVAGCDKSADSCRAKFNNIINFRGFPHLPGEDWVTAYPKSGEIHDGRSRTRS